MSSLNLGCNIQTTPLGKEQFQVSFPVMSGRCMGSSGAQSTDGLLLQCQTCTGPRPQHVRDLKPYLAGQPFRWPRRCQGCPVPVHTELPAEALGVHTLGQCQAAVTRTAVLEQGGQLLALLLVSSGCITLKEGCKPCV